MDIIIIRTAMTYAFSKLWQAVSSPNTNIAKKIVYGFERILKYTKMHRGKKSIRNTYFQVIKN